MVFETRVLTLQFFLMDICIIILRDIIRGSRFALSVANGEEKERGMSKCPERCMSFARIRLA